MRNIVLKNKNLMPALNFIGGTLCTILAVVIVTLKSLVASGGEIERTYTRALRRLSWFSQLLKTSCFLPLLGFYLLLLCVLLKFKLLLL